MVALIVLAIILGLVGIIGSIVPGIPGPPLSWLGMMLVFLYDKGADSPEPMTAALLLSFLAITIIVSVLDYVVPPKLTRLAGGHKAASVGALVGLFAGMFFTPVGVVTGSLLGAFIGELMVNDKGLWPAFKAGAGAFGGFLIGIVLKLAASGVMFWLIVKYAIF